MPHSAFQPLKGKTSLPSLERERLPLHQYYVPNLKAKSKSRAISHNMEFLSKVFASEGASRFFITFLMRFLFDSGNQSSEDYSTALLAA
jgi:hypothetical protein